MIEVISLSFSYETTPVLTGVDLFLRRGETLVLSGPSGAGKSTLARLIAGLDVPDHGEIKIDDRIMNHGAKRVLPHQRSIGMVFQQPALWPHMTVEAHLGFVATGNLKERKQKIWGLLEATGLGSLSTRRPDQLSGGQAHRLGIARALAAGPRYLIMDEPFANIDPKTKNGMIELVKSESAALGAGLFVITHDDREASLIGGQRLWMRDGKLGHEQEVEASSLSTGRRYHREPEQ